MKITKNEKGFWLPDEPIKVKLSAVRTLCPEMQKKFFTAAKVGICEIINDES